jgi:hypothetical protein
MRINTLAKSIFQSLYPFFQFFESRRFILHVYTRHRHNRKEQFSLIAFF